MQYCFLSREDAEALTPDLTLTSELNDYCDGSGYVCVTLRDRRMVLCQLERSEWGSGLHEVCPLSETSFIAIMSGMAYYIRCDDSPTVDEIPLMLVMERLNIPGKGCLLCDCQDAIFVRVDGVQRDFERLAADGIKDLRYHDDTITGLAWTGSFYPFKLSLSDDLKPLQTDWRYRAK